MSTGKILIVGAGPTGLTLALALAKHGIPFTLVEKKPGPSSNSKGLSINVASQAYLGAYSMPSAIGASACRLSSLKVFYQGDRLTKIDFDRVYPPVRLLIQPQSDTELELINALGSLNRSVQWGVELLAIQQTEKEVLARVRYSDGNEEALTFEYAIGCEGKRSIIREALNASFDGHEYPFHFILGDYELSGEPFETISAQYHVYEDEFFILVPLGHKCIRVVLSQKGPHKDDYLDVLPSLKEVVNRRLGRRLLNGAPLWHSSAPFYFRRSSRMQNGRLFICGDSAHLTSPIGGTGMNLGIQDAIHLAWRLAYVLKGYCPVTELSNYEIERLPSIASVLDAVDQSTKIISGIERIPGVVREFLPEFRNREAIRSIHPVSFSGLGLPAFQTSVSWQGKFFPFCHYLSAADKVISVSPTRCTAIVVVDENTSAECAHKAVGQLLAIMEPTAGANVLIVSTNPAISQSDFGDIEVINLRKAPHSLLTKQRLIFLSPDLIIRYIGDLLNDQPLRDFIARFFIQSSSVKSRH